MPIQCCIMPAGRQACTFVSTTPAQLLLDLERFPRVPLGHTPTPIDAADNLGPALGVELLIKRDDCTGLAFGGNKIRQLEYYLGEARAQRSDTVLITGAVQSNFVRATAAAARCLRMDIHVQLEERVAGVDEVYRSSGNVLLDQLLGARLHSFPVGEDEAGADRSLEQLAERLRGEGKRPYVVHLGPDHVPVGGLGYVRAAIELLGQLDQDRIELDAIVVASGSALTHAGLLVGLRVLGASIPVHGVCVRRPQGVQLARVRQRSAELAALIGRADAVAEADIHLTDIALAPGYGELNRSTVEAIRLAARHEGLLLDPVYTGKSMAGLISLVAAGDISPGSRVLFVHTGGQPALFGYQAELLRELEAFDRDA